MNEQECLSKMVAPGTRRAGKYRSGVVQVHVTRACDKACCNCTQNSQAKGPPRFISVDNFEACVRSLAGYYGVVGVFGGNPALHPKFGELCEVMRKHVPFEQRGLWCNNPMGKGAEMRRTFNPAVSNINVHLDKMAYVEFKRNWPEVGPVGVASDSRHAPVFVSMKDVGVPEEERWDLISRCDINQHWSAMCGEFRGEPRAWFCEVAGAQAIMHQDEEGYPDTGEPTTRGWWQRPMEAWAHQVRHHCHDCGVPMRGRGELAVSGIQSQVSAAHGGHVAKRGVYELVTVRPDAKDGPVTKYLERAT